MYRQLGQKGADLRNPRALRAFFDTMQTLVRDENCWRIMTVQTAVCLSPAEMAFAGHCGVNADISAFDEDILGALFTEERVLCSGCVKRIWMGVVQAFTDAGLADMLHVLR